ncbi:plasma membrane H+-ATPase [Ceratobasidium sp. 395]|nr:plasma membrane H+-ATPase [Ceratobasidium sp. 395]
MGSEHEKATHACRRERMSGAWRIIESAALVAIVLSNDGRAPDRPDFVGIVLLLLINSAIGFYEEHNAGNAVKTLMDSLAPKTKVKRDGKWPETESAILVPGDMVASKIGDIVPADCRLTEPVNVSIDQAPLTGGLLPQSKKTGDQCFSAKPKVSLSLPVATLSSVAPRLVGQDDDTTGHLQKILAQIGSFCLVSIGLFVLLEIVILYPLPLSHRRGLDDLLFLLPCPLSCPLPSPFGAQQLAKHKAIVTRITAIEALTGVTILRSDKTGTLTTNKLTIDKNFDAIDQGVVGTLDDPTKARAGIKVLDFQPFNPVDQRIEITYREESSSKLKRTTEGMTGIIIELCSRNKTEEVES